MSSIITANDFFQIISTSNAESCLSFLEYLQANSHDVLQCEGCIVPIPRYMKKSVMAHYLSRAYHCYNKKEANTVNPYYLPKITNNREGSTIYVSADEGIAAMAAYGIRDLYNINLGRYVSTKEILSKYFTIYFSSYYLNRDNETIILKSYTNKMETFTNTLEKSIYKTDPIPADKKGELLPTISLSTFMKKNSIEKIANLFLLIKDGAFLSFFNNFDIIVRDKPNLIIQCTKKEMTMIDIMLRKNGYENIWTNSIYLYALQSETF